MLRSLLETLPESVQNMDAAADERYWEGLELMAGGRHGAGIYLMGYAAEIKLKVAYCRFHGARPQSALSSR